MAKLPTQRRTKKQIAGKVRRLEAMVSMLKEICKEDPACLPNLKAKTTMLKRARLELVTAK